MIDYSVIGSRIKLARKNKGMTQNSLSEILNVSPEYISRLESGTAKINLEMMVKIAGILSVEPEGFLSGATEASSNYLSAELNECLKVCTPKKIEAILKMARVISEL